MNPFGHIDLRVRELQPAVAFYAGLLRELGFTRTFSGESWSVFATEGELPSAAFFALIEKPDHQPNENRIAFWVKDPGEVDRLGALLAKLGATIESGPRRCPEYSDAYYAVFFTDPSGNKLEVVHRTS